MANKHYTINDEVEITIKVKVKIKNISNYHQLSDEEIQDHIKDFKNEIHSELSSKIVNEYYGEEITQGVDSWNYEVIETSILEETITQKMDLIVTCPHCGNTTCHTFYIGSDTLICHNDSCGKDFNIKISAKDVKVKTHI